MLHYFQSLAPVTQVLIATAFTWAMTASGAALVFLARDVNKKILDGLLGFAAGVMIAVTYWSLLAPAIAMSKAQGLPGWIPASSGFLLGACFVFAIDRILPHLHHLGLPSDKAEGIKTKWQRSILLVLAITLHNFPEGLAIGIAFGAAAAGYPAATLTAAIVLALGIGIQNLPEGMAVSMPLHREGLPHFKSFWYGQLSAVVEPIGGLIGLAALTLAQPLLPYALSFAAGAMFFVVVEELIPESQYGGNTDLATMGAILGFTVMMILDVAFV